MSAENKLYFKAEKEAIFLLLTGIGDEIYSTVDDATQLMRCAKSAIILGTSCGAQHTPDNLLISTKPQRTNTTSSSTRPSASTRHKGKEIAKPVTPQSESVSEEDSDPEQAQRDKDMQKNLALLAKYFKRLYKPTNNTTFELLSNSRNKTEDTTIKRAKAGLKTTSITRKDDDVQNKLKQEMEAHYSFMAKIRRSYQKIPECVVEHAALANLIANLTLDTEENETILKN
ncbi:hypothetical protein Tco_0590930 [Tanacetum coccineum]